LKKHSILSAVCVAVIAVSQGVASETSIAVKAQQVAQSGDPVKIAEALRDYTAKQERCRAMGENRPAVCDDVEAGKALLENAAAR
jgi:hypothetical protein